MVYKMNTDNSNRREPISRVVKVVVCSLTPKVDQAELNDTMLHPTFSTQDRKLAQTEHMYIHCSYRYPEPIDYDPENISPSVEQ
jgi:hypothetical protein